MHARKDALIVFHVKLDASIFFKQHLDSWHDLPGSVRYFSTKLEQSIGFFKEDILSRVDMGRVRMCVGVK